MARLGGLLDRRLLGLAALLVTTPSLPAQAVDAPARVIRARFLMGTIFRFEAPAGGDSVASSLESALDEVQRLELILSNWNQESELSRLNARAGKGATRVSGELFAAVDSALRWARKTGGAFDPTVEPLTRLLRSGNSIPGPTSAAGPVRGPGQRVRWKEIVLDPVAGTVEIPAGGGLDLGGIGKGIALDRAARILSAGGIHNVLLDAGGQILAVGSPPGERGWRVALADPADRQEPAYTLLLRDISMATSGNSERPGEIVDPATDRIVAGRYTATSFAADATAADALSTSLFVMGPQAGAQWARQRTDVLALYLDSPVEGGPPRASGTLTPPAPGHSLEVSATWNRDRGRLHAENR